MTMLFVICFVVCFGLTIDETFGQRGLTMVPIPAYKNQPPNCIPWWQYRGDRGQDHWCCTGNHKCCFDDQSPIDIDIRHSSYAHYHTCLEILNHEYCPNVTQIQNTGYTGFKSIKLNGRTYYFNRLNFHWGRNSSYGSEHTLDGVRLPLEMQMIYSNPKVDGGFAPSTTHQLLVVSVLFTLSYRDNDMLRDLIYHLHQVTWKGQRACIKPFPLTNLMPERFGHYYTYNGSLTFPPCTPNVTWIVLHNPVYISEYQLNEFRRLQQETEEYCPRLDCPIVDNYRDTQCIKKRRVLWKEQCEPLLDLCATGMTVRVTTTRRRPATTGRRRP